MAISKRVLGGVISSLAVLLVAAPAAAGDDSTAAASEAEGKDRAPSGLRDRLSVMAGLTQWLLFRGGNLAGEYKTGRWAFEVSHGQGLDLNQLGGFALTSTERDQGLRLRVPWTTGFGVGYRITENLHVLVEAKAHRYEATSADGAHTVKYTTLSVGPGAFYSIYFDEHVFLQPNVRFWPNIASTLDGNRATLRRANGTSHEHEAHDFSVFANVSLGYTL